MPKDFKTIDEQIEILKSRGLHIENEELAKEFLLYNNYYRVSGYSLTLRNHDKFFENATFQNIIDIYNFDYKLRHVLLKYLEKIEVKIKSVYAYMFTKKYGPLGYSQSTPFTDVVEYANLILKVSELADRNVKNEAFLKHFKEELHEPYPFWTFIELFTLSDVSKLYSITKQALKDEIALSFGFNASSKDKVGTYLKCFSILRNLCAHNGRLYNRLFVTKPSLNSKEKALLNKTKSGEVDNLHLFGYIISSKRFLSLEDYNCMKDDIYKLNKKYPFVDMKYYGFNPNWYDLI